MGILCFCDHVIFVVSLMLESAVHKYTKNIYIFSERLIHIYFYTFSLFRFTADMVVFRHENDLNLYVTFLQSSCIGIDLSGCIHVLYNKVKGFHIVIFIFCGVFFV